MKKLLSLTFCLLIATLMAGHAAQTEKAEELIKKVWNSYRINNFETEESEITITKEGSQPEKKKLVRYILFSPTGDDKITIKYLEPALDKGLGLLTHRKKSGDEQWLKLPSLGNSRKISTAKESEYFGGTDLTYEDAKMLTGEKTDEHNYIAGPDGAITSTPKTGTITAYGKRIIYVTKDHAISHIAYFDKNGLLIKTLTNNNIKIQANGFWRPAQVTIDNKKLKRKTVITIVGREYKNIPSSYFTKESLEK